MIKNFCSIRPNLLFLLIVGSILVTNSTVRATERTKNKSLIVYYSKTGNTRTACQVIQNALDADIVEIRDLTNRDSIWGIATGMLYTILGWHTDISPEYVDISAYSNIVIAFPIWAGSFPPAMRTFVETNDFRGKETVIFTTSTTSLDAVKKNAIEEIVSNSNGNVIGHSQVLAVAAVDGTEKKKTKQQIAAETKALCSNANSAFDWCR